MIRERDTSTEAIGSDAVVLDLCFPLSAPETRLTKLFRCGQMDK